jgi:hypothetical protein
MFSSYFIKNLYEYISAFMEFKCFLDFPPVWSLTISTCGSLTEAVLFARNLYK